MSKANFNKIKAILAEKNKTNKKLASELGVKPQTVSNWCRNVKQPSIETLFEIAKYLNVEAGDLLTSIKNLETL